MDRRIVLRHASGRIQISGLVSGDVTPSELRSLPEVQSGQCTLERVEKRYVLYREVTPTLAEDGA